MDKGEEAGCGAPNGNRKKYGQLTGEMTVEEHMGVKPLQVRRREGEGDASLAALQYRAKSSLFLNSDDV